MQNSKCVNNILIKISTTKDKRKVSMFHKGFSVSEQRTHGYWMIKWTCRGCGEKWVAKKIPFKKCQGNFLFSELKNSFSCVSSRVCLCAATPSTAIIQTSFFLGKKYSQQENGEGVLGR
jgi:hypothetical protein